MVSRRVVVWLTLLCFLTVPVLALAQAKPEDAQAWVKKGIEFYKANGKDKALAAFSDPKGEFMKGDLYIYVLDLNGKMLAHPKAELVGKDFMVVKDADGKTFAVDIVKTAKEKGSGWVDYKWENPATKAVDPKTVYFEKVDDLIICSGAYKK
ncbi:MAG: cache domain-containing protein [Desulfobaccales bacterium]|jgi:signal transduction histidine kinase